MDLIQFGKAVADETRHQIMELLCCRWLCVSELVAQTDVSQPTVSHHLAVLRQAGLVRARRAGRQVYYTLDQTTVEACCNGLLVQFAPERALEGGQDA
jgi:DNA-binding transcriptional ArsR family regulator